MLFNEYDYDDAVKGSDFVTDEKKKTKQRSNGYYNRKTENQSLKNFDKKMSNQIKKQKDLQSGKKKNNFPTAFEIDPTKTSTILKNIMTIASMPKCYTEDEFVTRFNDYFNFCVEQEVKPTVESFALAFGVTTATIRNWESGEYGSFKKDLVKRGKTIMQAFLTNAVMEGSVNPVTYIFYSKNYYGMVDKVEHVENTGFERSDEAKRELIDSLPSDDFE